MLECGACGGRLRRVRRGFWERFRYRSLYECWQCGERSAERLGLGFYSGPNTRCPNCGTERLSRLRSRDHIDKMYRGPVNFLSWALGGNLYHCTFCRIQFYDVRKPPELRDGR